MATVSHWLELLIITLTFGACVTAIALIALTALRKGWGAPLPRRRFLPLLWVLAFIFAGWLPPPFAYFGLSLALAFLGVEFSIKWLLIPLGWVRATYVLSRLAGHSGFPPDARLRPALLAAQALDRQASPETQRFVEQRLLKIGELGPLGAAAAALLAQSRGDAAAAEGILRGVASVADPEQNALLWPAFRAISYQDRPSSAPLGTEPAAEIEASLAALAALARRLPGRARAEDVEHAVRSLDALRASPGWITELDGRAVLLGAPGGGAVARAQVLAQAESDLAEAALAERWPAAWLGSGPTADAVRVSLREQRLATAERLAAELQRRANEARSLPEAEEWQAWGELLRVSQELEQDATTAADRQLLFRALHRPIWNYGYHQAFVLGRRHLGTVVFLRQRRLAYAAAAAETYAVIEGNIRAARARANAAKHEDSAIWYCQPRFVGTWRRFNSALLRVWFGVAALAGLGGYAVFGPARGTLFVALLLSLLCFRSLRQPVLVEVLRHGGRVWVQTESLRWSVAAPELQLRPSFWRFSRVVLKRAPWWLPGVLFTVHGSREAAERERAAFQEASGGAGSPASG